MDEWQVIFYPDKNNQEPVKEFILQLDYNTRHEIIHVIDLLYQNNVLLSRPYVEKIANHLRVLRVKHGSDIYRIFFFAFKGKQFILLHIFQKKTDKLPENEIALAVKRMLDYRERFEY